MKLYSETMGSGPNLLLIHGWGAHSGVWSGVREELAENFCVTCIDLPGHGRSAYKYSAMESLPSLAEAVLAEAPEHASWLGWSLGGLVAQQAALLEPARIEKLILLGSTPSFIIRDGWPCAVEADVFEAFHQDLIKDASRTLLRFIALQTRGSKQASDDSRLLKKILLQPAPSSEALQTGLRILRQADLREQVSEISAPVLLLAGMRDTLLPNGALTKIAGLFKNAMYEQIEKAGHAPFLSHREVTLKAIKSFLIDSQEIEKQHV